MENLEKRMYFLVPYNISPIQQAIQAGHAALEYAHEYGDDPYYVDFIENWKTWIILNGGTTNKSHENGEPKGSLDKIYSDLLLFNKIKFSVFHEPDLNDALTAICLIVDERVFNREKYPDFNDWIVQQNCVWVSIGKQSVLSNEDELRKSYEELMGKDIVFLKELLNTKKLA